MIGMASSSFYGLIPYIKSPLALAAFGIAALITIIYLRKSKAPSILIALSIVFIAVCALLLEALAQYQQRDVIYRVRVTVRDSDGSSTTTANVTASVLNDSTVSPGGAVELSIPRGSLPADRVVTIFAKSGDQRASRAIKLGSDLTPAVSLKLDVIRTSGVAGLLEDQDQRVIEGADVLAASGERTTTDKDGHFSLPALSAKGQQVRLHFEKAGYRPFDDYFTAGGPPVIVLLKK